METTGDRENADNIDADISQSTRADKDIDLRGVTRPECCTQGITGDGHGRFT